MAKNDEKFQETDLTPKFDPNYSKIENAGEENNWGATWKNVDKTKK